MLYETFFQCVVCSGKAFSKLMRKHKGLLRIDLRSNANGMSGVLEMMPKGSAKTANALDSASSGLLGKTQQTLQAAKVVSNSLFPEPNATHGHDTAPHASAVGDGPVLALAANAVSSSYPVEEQRGSGPVIPQKPTRKGLVPMFTPDGQQQEQLIVEAGKENFPAGSDTPEEPKGRSKAHKAKCEGSKGSKKTKPAGKPQLGAQHVRQHSTACTAGFQFGKMPRLRSQPTACLSHFVPAAEEEEEIEALGCDQGEVDNATEASSSQHWQTDEWQVSAHQNPALGSATFGDWNRSCEDSSQAVSRSDSMLAHNASALKFERPRTAGIAGSTRRTVSFQECRLTEAAYFSRSQPEITVDLAGDASYIQGMSQARREVEAAEDLGRQRAAAESEHTLHQLGAPLAAYYTPESAADMTQAAADPKCEAVAASSVAVMTQSAADRKVHGHRARPGSPCPAGTRLAAQGSGAAAQQRIRHCRVDSRAAFPPDQARSRGEATSLEDMSAGYYAQSYPAPGREGGAVSSMTDQAATAAVAMEAAKSNVWRAEVMCELEGLKCSLEGAAADSRRYALTCLSQPRLTKHSCPIVTAQINAYMKLFRTGVKAAQFC